MAQQAARRSKPVAKSPTAAPGTEKAKLLELYRQMLLIRRFEERAEPFEVRGRQSGDPHAASQADASASIVVSFSDGATIWSPTGSPAFVGAHGTLIAGSPARLAGSV